MVTRCSFTRLGALVVSIILLMPFLTISSSPTTRTATIDDTQNTKAQVASFGGCSVLLNSSTFGSLQDICVDSLGYLYITGSTTQPLFPIVDGYDDTFNGAHDCFLVKMNGTDGSILYSTFLGGSGIDYGSSICVDEAGCIYVLGLSNSEDFPLVNPYDSNITVASQYFLTKFDSTGQTLIYSTFFGPEFREGFNSADFDALAVDEEGCAYLVGSTTTPNVTIVNAFDSTYNGGTDCYILKLNPTGTEIVYASFYGTQYTDSGSDLYYTENGTLYVSGTTSIYPSEGYYVSPGPDYGGHCFVLKISRDGTLLHSGDVKSPSFFPHTSIVVDSEYSIYLLDDDYSAWLFAIYKLDVTFNQKLYTKVLGGSNFTQASAFSIDSEDRIYVAGRTFSKDFVRNSTGLSSIQYSSNSYSGEDDCFLVCMNSAGGVIFSNLFGSIYREYTQAIAVVDDGFVYLAGSSVESQPSYNGYYSSFILSIHIPKLNTSSFLQLDLILVGISGFVILALVIIIIRRR